MAGPTIRHYNNQAIIYFDGDPPEEIYVLKSGRIILTYTDIDTKAEIKEDVKIGEFFGVRSTLGHYPREETAQVIGGATVLVFKLPEFETFVANRTHLIIKMMKVFSSQLRQYHRKVRENLGDSTEVRSPSYELVNVGEVFYRNGEFEHATHAFEKYLQYYPGGVYSGRVQELLNFLKRGSAFPPHMPTLAYEKERQGPVSVQDANRGAFQKPSPKPVVASTNRDNSLKGLYQQAREKEEGGKYSEAISLYRAVTEMQASDDERNNHEEAFFSLGRCQKTSMNLDAAFISFSNLLKNYPQSGKAKEAILNMAEISEQKSDKAKAIALYSKLISMPPADTISDRARQKIQELRS